MSMKQIALKILGSDADPFEVYLLPEVTAGEILDDLNMEGEYVLASANTYSAREEATPSLQTIASA